MGFWNLMYQYNIMSNNIHQGKGSGNRTKNYRAYWDSPLWSSKERKVEEAETSLPKDNKRYLFLDDIRQPEYAYLWDEKQSLFERSGIQPSKWDVVRSYDEFVEYINTHGVPDVVSFDNDLNADHEVVYDKTKANASYTDMMRAYTPLIDQYQMIDFEHSKIKTGAHCAKYLVNFCKKSEIDIPEYYVHSANDFARPIIRTIMDNFQ
jgi:hypothetical protein